MTLFNEYTKSSCQFENTVFGLLDEFKCLPYFMPKIPNRIIKEYITDFQSNDSIICDAKKMKEMSGKIAQFSARSTGYEDARFIKSGNQNVLKCPDECDSTKYEYQVSYADLEDNGDFFFKALLRKGTKTEKAVNPNLKERLIDCCQFVILNSLKCITLNISNKSKMTYYSVTQ